MTSYCHFRARHKFYVSQGIVRDTIQVKWETFTPRYGKFNQENIHQILSESALFC